MFRIFTEISGGVTGARSSYVKLDGEVLEFDTKAEAEAYATQLRAARSPYGRFEQRWTVEGTAISDCDVDELRTFIETTRGDIEIADRLGNTGIAGNLRIALAKAKTDLFEWQGAAAAKWEAETESSNR